MEEIDEFGELRASYRRPPLRSMLSEPAESIDEHNDFVCSHSRQNFRCFTGHEFYSVSYISQFDHEPQVMLNFALSRGSQMSVHERGGFDDHFSPLAKMNSMKHSSPSSIHRPPLGGRENAGGSLTPGRRRSSGAGNIREQLATSHGSVFYSSSRSTSSFVNLAMSAVFSTYPSPLQSPPGPSAAATTAQTPSQASIATKRRLKAILTVDSKTTEILIANDNVKRVFCLLHSALIGKRLIEVFSSNVDEKPPTILYNELFTSNGKLKAIYGKAVDIIDAEGKRGAVCVWSYPLTHAAAAASERSLSGKQRMLVRAPSAVLSSSRCFGDSPNYARAGNVTTATHRCGLHCACIISPVTQLTQTQYFCPQGDPSITLPCRSISIQCTTPPTASQLAIAGRCSRAEKVRYGLDEMVEGGSSPLKDSVINGYYSESSNSEADEKEPDEEAHNDTSKRERGHITNGAAARRWLIVMEPISALSIACTLGAKGRIFRVDDSLATLLGYVSMSQLLGTEIGKLIPAVNLDADGEEQHVCALGIRGNSIPITVRIATERDPKRIHMDLLLPVDSHII